MAGAPGLEIWGPYDDHDEIRDAILEAGDEFGLRAGRLARLPVEHARVGLDPVAAAGHLHRARSCAPTASGCPADGYEATNALAGSFVSDNIEDYYLNPWELGYGRFVKFDHDFIGRDALEKIDPADAAQEGHARVERRRPHADLGVDASNRRARTTSSSTCRSPTTARRTTTRSIDADGKRRRPVDVHRLQREREAARSRSRPSTRRSSSAPSSTSSGASRTAARGRPPSSRTSRSRFASIVSPVPYSKVARLEYASGWRTSGAV